MKLAKKLAAMSITSGLAVGSFALATPAFSHGYVDGPKSRALLCKEQVNTNCGSVVYEPQSLEYLKGFPQTGPADGKIASANGQFGGLLDQQSSTRWAKTEITTGPLLIDWTYTAPHSTSGWSYYMTKPGWDQNAPLTRAQLEKIATIEHDGSAASTNPDHVINVPNNRSGYHVILAVWDISNTVNAFYNVIDVNVSGSSEEVVVPKAPTKLTATEKAAGGVILNWSNTNGERSDVSSVITRDGVQIGKSTGTSFLDTKVVPGETYNYSVVATDAQGNQSRSANVGIRVAPVASADVTAPTVPSKLHTMKVAGSEVNVMWGESFDASGDVTYKIYRDGYLLATTNMTMWKDTSVIAGTNYEYLVTAVDPEGNESAWSNVLGVTTPLALAPVPELSGTWNTLAAYKTGDTVIFNGSTYRAVQSHTGVGDPNWINALSLWSPVGAVVPEPVVSPVLAPVPVSKSFGSWSATGSYNVGDKVTSDGVAYQAVQSYTGVGDPNWINAPSLWQRL
jgi:chitin-binding protein